MMEWDIYGISETKFCIIYKFYCFIKSKYKYWLFIGYSRSGMELELLTQMYNSLPPFHLEGEVWFGRGMFYESQQIVGMDSPINWSSLR